jgi:hypothetical protein
MRCIRKIIKTPFHLVGLDLIRKSPADPESLPLFDDPFEALCYRQGGEPAAFRCPLEYTINENGFSYSPDGWHPFVATLREYVAGESTGYEDSVLRRFYETHQPNHAAEAIAGFDQAPSEYENYPAHVYRLTPWRSKTADCVDQSVRSWSVRDSIVHSRVHSISKHDWSFDKDGFQYHGPVSERKGRLEYQRLVSIYESIEEDDYDRAHGHATFLLLRRGTEFRYLNWGTGNHRTAAMTALGKETIPAVFSSPYIVDVGMAKYWPQVRSGAWTHEQAEAYFNHLFDFDSQAWARAQGLLRDPDRRS